MKAQYYIEWKRNEYCEWERIDQFSSRKEAVAMLAEYMIAFHSGKFRIKHRGEIECY